MGKIILLIGLVAILILLLIWLYCCIIVSKDKEE